MKILMGILLVFFGFQSSADEPLKISYFHEGRTKTTKPLVMTWTSEDKCSAFAPDNPKSQDVSSKTCKDLHTFVFSHWGELKEENGRTSNMRRIKVSSHLKFADLEVNDLTFGIMLTSAEHCDEYHRNCKPSSSNSADLLGFKVLGLIRNLK